MKTYQFDLMVQIQAHDDEEAYDITQAMKAALLENMVSPYKAEWVGVDGLEEV